MISKVLLKMSDMSRHEYHGIPLVQAAAVVTLTLALLSLTWFKLITRAPRRNMTLPLPPGPKGLPIVGNLPFIDPNLHTWFAKLANTYGPIFKLRLGSRLTIVITSPSLAREVLRDQDTIFSYRDVPAVGVAASHGCKDITFSPPDEHWKLVRKLAVRELLNNVSLAGLYDLRQREVQQAMSKLYLKIGQPIDVGDFSLATMFNLITCTLWGGRPQKNNEEETKRTLLEFNQVMNQCFPIFATPNISDLFPFFARFDIQGLGSKMKKCMSVLERSIDVVIDQHLTLTTSNNNTTGGQHKDFLDTLLQFKDQGDHSNVPFTMTIIKSMLMDMLVGGARTSSTTTEWAMTELLEHPEIMIKVQEELEEIVGKNNLVEESHLPKLKYVNAVVKETLRLHPVAPILAPKFASESCAVGGYMVPKGTKVIVNAWAIQRDPHHWENPLEFRPERFLEPGFTSAELRGTNFGFIPFGSGRRVCVGIPLVEKIVPYTLASFLHSFNWKLPQGTKLDLSSTFGLELKKTVPLIAIPTPRRKVIPTS